MTAQAQGGGNGLRLVSNRGGRSQHAGAYTVYLHLRLQIQINRELMIQVLTARKVQFGIARRDKCWEAAQPPWRPGVNEEKYLSG